MVPSRPVSINFFFVLGCSLFLHRGFFKPVKKKTCRNAQELTWWMGTASFCSVPSPVYQAGQHRQPTSSQELICNHQHFFLKIERIIKSAPWCYSSPNRYWTSCFPPQRDCAWCEMRSYWGVILRCKKIWFGTSIYISNSSGDVMPCIVFEI